MPLVRNAFFVLLNSFFILDLFCLAKKLDDGKKECAPLILIEASASLFNGRRGGLTAGLASVA